MSYKAL